jgi:hypothetical protein
MWLIRLAWWLQAAELSSLDSHWVVQLMVRRAYQFTPIQSNKANVRKGDQGRHWDCTTFSQSLSRKPKSNRKPDAMLVQDNMYSQLLFQTQIRTPNQNGKGGAAKWSMQH